MVILVGALSPFILIGPSRGGATPVLVLLVALGSTLLVSASNYISLYLAMELPTLSLFILVSQKGGSGLSAEAGLKYFVLGALASGLFLFGCGLLCGFSGGPGFPGEELGVSRGGISGGGGLLITGALLFKLSAAPFHMWAPDVYEGAPTATTALLATVPKVGVFSILVALGPVAQALLIAVLFSLVVGAGGALNQIKIKRLLAYSGIVHMGFVLWGIEMGSLESVQASLIYMVLYVIMAICAFAIVVVWGGQNLIVELGGLSRKEPILAITLGLAFFSIAGVPPLLGFLGKW
jgi:NADH-quinone oxidoreductase subunit N